LTPGGSSTVHNYTKTIHEQYNRSEYTEWNIHNNKNIYANTRTHNTIIKIPNITKRIYNTAVRTKNL
jgi:hypothetical protein